MMDPVSLFTFFFRYLYKDIPRALGIAGVLVAIVWGTLKYVDLSFVENMSLRPSPVALFVTATALLALGLDVAWHGYALYRDGWPLRWIWGTFVWVSYDQTKQTTKVELFAGMVENVSDDAVQLEELMVISGQTGRPLDVLLNDRYGKYLPAAQFHPLPPHSGSMDFRALFRSETEALSETEYWSQIGSLQFVAKIRRSRISEAIFARRNHVRD